VALIPLLGGDGLMRLCRSKRKLAHIGLLFGIRKRYPMLKSLNRLTIKYDKYIQHLFSVFFRDTLQAPTDGNATLNGISYVVLSAIIAFGDHKKSLMVDTRCLQIHSVTITAEQACRNNEVLFAQYTLQPVRIIDLK